MSQTMALLAIHSHDSGGGMAACRDPPCTGALEARGRTLDPFEKHFESYGHGRRGTVYRFGAGVGLNLVVAYKFHDWASQEGTLGTRGRHRARPGSTICLTGSRQDSSCAC
jgi:hypothetical protein